MSASTDQGLKEIILRSVVGVPLRVGFSFFIDAGIHVLRTRGDLEVFVNRFQVEKFATVSAAVFIYNFLDEKYGVTNRTEYFLKRVYHEISNR